MGVSPGQISRWEAGTNNIPSERLPAMAEAYQCRISEIFEDLDASGSEGRSPPSHPLPTTIRLQVAMPDEAALTTMMTDLLASVGRADLAAELAPQLARLLPGALERTGSQTSRAA